MRRMMLVAGFAMLAAPVAAQSGQVPSITKGEVWGCTYFQHYLYMVSAVRTNDLPLMQSLVDEKKCFLVNGFKFLVLERMGYDWKIRVYIGDQYAEVWANQGQLR